MNHTRYLYYVLILCCAVLCCVVLSTAGAVPHSLCRIPALSVLSFDGNSLRCFPECLSTVPTLGAGAIPQGCGSSNLCPLVAATGIGQLPAYSMWNCDSAGYSLSDPCLDSAVVDSGWTGVLCSADSQVVDITLENVVLGGTLPAAVGSLTALTSFALKSAGLTGQSAASCVLFSLIELQITIYFSLSLCVFVMQVLCPLPTDH